MIDCAGEGEYGNYGEDGNDATDRAKTHLHPLDTTACYGGRGDCVVAAKAADPLLVECGSGGRIDVGAAVCGGLIRC